MHNSTLFLTLRTFSATGGIEKVSRVLGKALYEFTGNDAGNGLKVMSMYDDAADVDTSYFPASIFRGFGQQKSRFVFTAALEGVKCRQVILSHCNILLAGYLVKLFSPKTRVILLAHGIEVWSPFSYWKQRMLEKCDLVLAVSNYTKEKMLTVHGLPADKVIVLNNCLDPYLLPPVETGKNAWLLKRYGLLPNDQVMMTITRLSSKEQYKGYDNVLYALKALLPVYPQLKYLLVGKYDPEEKARVEAIITELELKGHIILTGFIPEEELAAHFNIADLYIMPSRKEGFGIVFIEAMYYGKPVIAGNQDGSTDALANGKFGLLINPEDKEAIQSAIVKVFNNITAYIPNHDEVMQKFSYATYKQQLGELLNG